MNTETHIEAYEPGNPLALLAHLVGRLLTWIVVAGVATFVVWASMGTMAQPAPIPRATEDGWQRYQATAFAFSYPADWTVRPPSEQSEAYRLAPADQDNGARVTIAYLPASNVDLAQIERMGVAHVERNEAITRHFLRILPRTRLASRVAARVRYTADLNSGERVEGLWVAIPQPDGRVLAFILDVYPDAHFKTVHHTFKRLLASVTLEG